MIAVNCPDCKEGFILGFGCPGFKPIKIPCELCGTTGKVAPHILEWKKRGSELRKDRIARGNTCRAEAAQRGMDVIELSEMERGIQEPKPRA